MSFLGIILWIAAVAAAVLAVIQIARQSVSMREELEELRARAPEPAQGKAARRADVRPLFGELYENKPGPLDGISTWPGVSLACAAAGLFAIGIVTIRPGRPEEGPADSTVAVELAAARLRHDSLASKVDQLSDSIAVLQATQAPVPSARPARSERRPVKRAGTTAMARPAAPSPGVAPLPSLPNVTAP